MPGLAGTTLGRYRLLRRLGRGGMSEVYLAHDEWMNRNVAIKVVSSTHADYIERFHREAEAIGKLNHDHILPAFDYGEQEPWHYLVMPYIEHGTLRDRLVQGPLSLEEAGEILEQIASALQFAHDQGIIHRDIKPSNILLSDEHYTYLADFGLAKSLEGGHTVTQTGALLGTPEYMAPELAEGPATTSSDVYALGVLLYQMVAGQVPFSGETPIAVYWKQIRDQPEPPSHINHAIPRAVERVILRVLDKNPLRRYQTPEALAHAYARALKFPGSIEGEEMPHLSEKTAMDAEARAPASTPSEGKHPHPVRTLPGGQVMTGNRETGNTSQTPHVPLQEGRLVLPSNPIAAPSAVPLQRRRFARRTNSNSNLPRTRFGRVATPPPLEPLTPSTTRGIAEVQPQTQPAPQPRPRYPTRRRRSVPLQRRQRGNPLLIATLIGVGLLLLFVVPLLYIYSNYSGQIQLATATANANSTNIVKAAHTQAAQQVQATSTAGIAVTATKGTLILADDLSSNTNGRWSEDGTSCVFKGGTYHVVVKQTDFFQSCQSRALSLDDTAIQVTVSLLAGNSTGLLLRANAQQFYDFEITDQGQFFFRRHDAGGRYTDLITKTNSGAIAPGNKVNTLLVIASGDDFKLYINNVFVGEQHDSAYASGHIGFVADTLPLTPSAEGSFSNLKVFKA